MKFPAILIKQSQGIRLRVKGTAHNPVIVGAVKFNGLTYEAALYRNGREVSWIAGGRNTGIDVEEIEEANGATA